MRTDWASDLSVTRSLTWRYLFALSLVAVLSTAAWLSLHLVISEQNSTAVVVNISGRQRMLSQRTALFSNLLVNAPKADQPAIRSKLTDAIQLMERSHHGLTHGDESMSLPRSMSPAIHAMYFDGPNALDRQVETYIRIVHELLQLNDGALTPTNPQLQYITQNAPNALVSALDQMVRQYQLEGEASVIRLQKAETICWAVTLILLVLEATLIFHPFVRHLKAILEKLQNVTEELQLHQDRLEETVRQRTAELENRSNALTESEEKFRLISTVAKDAIVIIDPQEQVIYWNPAAEEIFGYEANEAVGKNLHNLLIPMRYREAAHNGFERFQRYGVGNVIGKTFEITALRKNNEEFPVELSVSSFSFRNNWHALGIIRNITERKQMEDQVRQLAFYDTLTNLPNRRLLNDRLRQAMINSKRKGHYAALMMLDLDNFKPLNDIHGHPVGDLLLIEVADRLKACVRETDTVARFGGDEFVVLLNDLSTEQTQSISQARIVAEKILNSLSAPYRLVINKTNKKTNNTVEHQCTASIGVVVFIKHDSDPDDLLKWADDAMYQAKDAGRNSVRFYDCQTDALHAAYNQGKDLVQK
ncbi:diguanylate cyclase [Candidatus Methylobacter oryzae]|uniref:Diguanylate cyclase n=1 Tax=Candidatus Methylobacter oryzae TaxID=2497749 RepID=A0ABY3C519_9GAMM|nr:diguanylate cyclase [Candidatus Methylobacter oryzae]